MNKLRLINTLVLCLICLHTSSLAKDKFEVLRSSGENFAEVSPGLKLAFPDDHGPHPEYRIEWWYITANLEDSEGQQWGLQWTLFRQALSAKEQQKSWSNNQMWMAHAAISSPQGHSYEERFSRGGIGQAGVELDDRFEAWIDDWRWKSDSNLLTQSNLEFDVGGRKVRMNLSNNDRWVTQGDSGYSQKSQQGQASYYYSQPGIKINGTIDDTPLSGVAWLDREWSSQPLAPNQQGWDWFSLHLDDGAKLMIYRLRQESGDHWLSGSWINNEGNKVHLNQQAIVLTVKEARQITTPDEKQIDLPLDWSISLPQQNRELQITPLYDQQWMGTSFPYWEGVVLVENEKGESLGRGYMELTGYQ